MHLKVYPKFVFGSVERERAHLRSSACRTVDGDLQVGRTGEALWGKDFLGVIFGYGWWVLRKRPRNGTQTYSKRLGRGICRSNKVKPLSVHTCGKNWSGRSFLCLHCDHKYFYCQIFCGSIPRQSSKCTCTLLLSLSLSLSPYLPLLVTVTAERDKRTNVHTEEKAELKITIRSSV